MTYTLEQLQKMRDWVALNVMNWKLMPETTAEYAYYFDPLEYDNNFASDEQGYKCVTKKWKPDRDERMLFTALDTLSDGGWEITITISAPSCCYVTLFRRRVLDDVLHGSVAKAHDKSLGLAALIAMCRASGMPE